jgi:hypothetical protein
VFTPASTPTPVFTPASTPTPVLTTRPAPTTTPAVTTRPVFTPAPTTTPVFTPAPTTTPVLTTRPAPTIPTQQINTPIPEPTPSSPLPTIFSAGIVNQANKESTPIGVTPVNNGNEVIKIINDVKIHGINTIPAFYYNPYYIGSDTTHGEYGLSFKALRNRSIFYINGIFNSTNSVYQISFIIGDLTIFNSGDTPNTGTITIMPGMGNLVFVNDDLSTLMSPQSIVIQPGSTYKVTLNMLNRGGENNFHILFSQSNSQDTICIDNCTCTKLI